ncbi:MAG: hypothetical protein UW94_C0001G0071 [Parcubacteria group bacterium GW2011_GWA2_45_14]|nr:MAG: hypothetical protein UW94_C0001G0071 [Parcubacteria group bacterium GW2011_GWA2_45_14]
MLVPRTPGHGQENLEGVSAGFSFTAKTFSSFLDHDPDIPLGPIVVAGDALEPEAGEEGVVVLGEEVLEISQGLGIERVPLTEVFETFTEVFFLPRSTTRFEGFRHPPSVAQRRAAEIHHAKLARAASFLGVSSRCSADPLFYDTNGPSRFGVNPASFCRRRSSR